MKETQKTFFAITSLGKNRWYWVVWPSLELLRTGMYSGHLADGYQPTKAQAVEHALEAAGMHGEWVAAKYARQYHRMLVHQRKAEQVEQGRAPAMAPAQQEFLYRDVRDENTQYFEGRKTTFKEILGWIRRKKLEEE